MIYQPQIYFNVYHAIGGALISAAVRYAADYITQSGRPWEYYVGYGLGGAALATGIPGANAILYTVGAGTYTLFLEKSPGATEVRILLDGVEDATLDLYEPAIDVLEYAFNLDASEHVIEVINLGSTAASATPEDWLSILAIEAIGGQLVTGENFVATVSIGATIRDAKTLSTGRVRNTQSLAYFIDSGSLTLAQLITYWEVAMAAIDGVTGGVIESGSLTLFPDLPGGLNATPAANSDVQEGGLLTFSLTGLPYTDAVRIPAFDQTLFGADGISIPNAGATATLITLLTGGAASPNDIAAQNRFAATYAAFAAGKKSFRK